LPVIVAQKTGTKRQTFGITSAGLTTFFTFGQIMAGFAIGTIFIVLAWCIHGSLADAVLILSTQQARSKRITIQILFTGRLTGLQPQDIVAYISGGAICVFVTWGILLGIIRLADFLHTGESKGAVSRYRTASP